MKRCTLPLDKSPRAAGRADRSPWTQPAHTSAAWRRWNPSSVYETFGITDVGIEIFDKQSILSGGSKAAPTSPENRILACLSYKMEITRGMQVMRRQRLQAQATKENVHARIGNRDKGLFRATKVRNETFPEPTDVARMPGLNSSHSASDEQISGSWCEAKTALRAEGSNSPESAENTAGKTSAPPGSSSIPCPPCVTRYSLVSTRCPGRSGSRTMATHL
jgi:hypothetical protein